MSRRKKGRNSNKELLEMRVVDFLNCKIDVSKKVFQPRIETEFWIKEAIEEIQNAKLKIKILDIFSGSGCIGTAALKNIKNCRVDFVDIDDKAISQIKINLKLNKIPKNEYEIYKSNLFEKLRKKKYDVVFANPPYVALERISEVDKEVLKKEPKMALFAGRDGMVLIEKFFKKVKNHLKTGGVVYLEFDPLQKEKIKEVLKKCGFQFFFRKDQFRKYRWLKLQP